MSVSQEVTAESLRSGKSGDDENFPVASLLIAPHLRPVILAFYDFVRCGDDVADNPDLPPAQKHKLLNQLDDSLTGDSLAEPVGVKLRAKLAERGLTDRHALDLLNAFRLDADKNRCADWGELIDYCRLSAMPVGRFMLDVHGESQELWPASDAVCAALQINNHLQDCGKDFRSLNRAYVPLDALAEAGAHVEDLAADKATPQLLACLQTLARKNRALLEVGAALPGAIKNFRMGLEIAVIVHHARKISDLLEARDPLSQNVKLGKGQMLFGALLAAGSEAFSRLGRRA
jgi:squalene synthase HpnC